ncbi:MAG: acyl-CoA thioesterase [Bacteroidota bacterium]
MENQLQPKRVTASHTIMTEMIMPNDTNPMGNLMGGNLLRWMDIVSAVCAGKHCERHVVTASADHVSFKEAIHVGEVITLEASVTRAFRSSVEVVVEVYASDIKGHNPRHCNSAYFTFVALDQENGKPVNVPGVTPITEIERQRFESAPRRREVRMILAGRMKPEEATEIRALFEAML